MSPKVATVGPEVLDELAEKLKALKLMVEIESGVSGEIAWSSAHPMHQRRRRLLLLEAHNKGALYVQIAPIAGITPSCVGSLVMREEIYLAQRDDRYCPRPLPLRRLAGRLSRGTLILPLAYLDCLLEVTQRRPYMRY